MAIGNTARRDLNHVPVSLATNGTDPVEIQCDDTGRLIVSGAPPAGATNTYSRATSGSYKKSLVVKASAGRLFLLTGYNSNAAAQFVQVHDAAAVPADGVAPVYTFVVPQGNFSLDLTNIGDYFSNGIVVCNSSTGPTKTIGADDCWFTALYL